MVKQSSSPKGQTKGHITKPLSDLPHNKWILGMTKSKCHDPKRKNNKLTGKFIIGGEEWEIVNDL
jgi:hypothetical protein